MEIKQNSFCRLLKGFSLSLLLLSLLAVPAWAQSSNGSVRGTVQDQTQAVIPNVAVSLVNTATGVELKTTTNEVGIYVFPSVVPGPYKIVANFSGMKTYEATLTVQTQQSVNLAVTMVPSGTTTTVSVQDVTPMVTTDNPTLSHTLERTRIEQLPLNGRNVMALLQTVPGLNTENGVRTLGTRGGTHDVSLDGSALTDAVYGGNAVSRLPSLDSIQEFNVVMNSASAKYARQTNIVMTTKGGTNELHGSLFETNRNNGYGVARARDNFTNKAAKLNRNEYGGTVGGPLVLPKVYDGKNRTFWFFSYEGMKQRTGNFKGFRVPTEAMRNGDFSGLVDGAGTFYKIYNPYTTDPVTYARQQFNYGGVANRIDPALQSPLSQYFNKVVPMPNVAGVNPLVANNYFAPTPQSVDQYTFSMRFDHRITDKDQVYVRLTDSFSQSNTQGSRGVPMLDGIGNSAFYRAPNKSISVNWTRSFSPTFFNEMMFSGTRNLASNATGDINAKYATELGLPNPNNQVGFPVINNIGVGAGASNYFQPVNATSQYFNYFILDDNGTKIVGRHELQFGAHLRYDQLTYLPQQQQSGGSVSFAANSTGLYDPNVPARTRGVLNTGHVAAAAYLGVANYTYRVVKGKYYMRQNEDALYFQDNFKATNRLTLNLGLRWQFSPYPKDKYDIFSSFDKNTMSVVLGAPLEKLYAVGATTPGLISKLEGLGAKFVYPQDVGLPSRLVNNQWHDIGPHLGFAYRGGDGAKSFVLRGGYSTSYFPVPIYGWNDRMRINMPFTSVYQNFLPSAGWSSPDGKPNYGLIMVPSIIAGKNSSTAISLDNPRGIAVGEDSFQTAYFNPDQASSRVHDWNLTLEKEVMSNTVLRVAYVGNHATHQDSYTSWNAQTPEYVWMMTRGEYWPWDDPWVSARVRPNPNLPYGELQEYRRDGWGWSNGGQIELERRYSKGFGYQVFYTMINASKAGAHGWYEDSQLLPPTSFMPGAVPQDDSARFRMLLYGRDTTIPKHEIRWNWIADLPFGKGKLIGKNANRLLDGVIGGWQVSGMGRWRSNYFTLPGDWSGLWPTGEKVEYYGHKYPIQDCRSGKCLPGYLMWNGYIPAHQINSYGADGKPNGVMGVPEDYKAAVSPIHPYPANYRSIDPANDPMYPYYGGSTAFIPLKDGSIGETEYNPLNPYRNQPIASTNTWTCDASLFKAFSVTEKAKLRVQVDFFNVFNTPGNSPSAGGDGLVGTWYNQNTPRQTQLSARFTW